MSVVKGRILQIVSNRFQVLLDGKTVDAIALGKMRLSNGLVVGDKVLCEYYQSKWMIVEVLSRENELSRPKIANVDCALVMISSVKPDFSSLYTDRLLFMVQMKQIHPILIFTKMDKVDESALIHRYIQDYRHSGYEVFEVTKDNDLSALKERLNGLICVMCGNSGVGKSTLLNRLDNRLNLKTQQVSLALNRGKHTTTKTTLHKIGQGYIADTPGFSSLTITADSLLTLSGCLEEFKPYLQCRFRNCLHVSEPGCQVKQAVENKEISAIRYQNYLKVIHEIKEGKG